MSQEQVVSVRLRRGATSTPWGFRMQGGHEYGSPLYIQQVNPKSLSMRQGLRVGDRLLAIGPVQAHKMSHEQAKMEIIRAGNELDLIVQRNASAVIDQPDSRPVQRPVESYEEPTQYRGYTNPNVQSRSFKILQESLSYSEADEEGIVLPTGSTPGEGIVRKAYSEGRRRLEELSELNPRNFTEGGQSPYRYTEHYLIKDESNISPDVPDAPSGSRQRQIPDSSIAASRVYDGKVAGGSPQARTQVDLANSSVLSPAAGQQQYLQQARRHYQQYYEDDQPTPQPVPAVHFQPVVHNVQQARPVVVQEQRSEGRPLKLVNYHFEEQYGHMHQDPQPGGRQKAVVSPQKSTDFIPATQTVSSVAADLDLKIVSPDTETNLNQIGVSKVIQHQSAQVVVGQPQKTETRRVRQRTRGHTTQTTSNVVVTSVTQQAQVPAKTQIDTTDGCLMSKTAPAAQSPVVHVPSAQPVVQATVQQIRVTQDAAQQGPVIQVATEPTPAPQAVAQPTPVVQVVEQPVPVVQEVTQPTPVSQVVVQSVAIEKEPEQAQETSETTPTQEPEPVSQVVAQPTPVPEEVAKPVPVQEEVKQPAPVAQEITQSTPVQEEPEPATSSAQEITEEASSQESQQPKKDTTTQEQVAETQKETVVIETSVEANATVAQDISVVEQSVPKTPVSEEQTVTENVEITATTTDESKAVTIEAVEAPNTQASEVVVIEQKEIPAEESSAQSVTLSVDNVVAETAISVQSEGDNVEEAIVVEESTNIAADTSAEDVEETVSFAISTTDEEASESVSLALDTSENSEETVTLSDNSAAFEIASDAEVSLNISSDVTITAEGSDVGSEESEATTIILSSDNVTETVENSADAEVSLSISSDVTFTTDEPTNAESEVATITIAQDAEEVSPSEEDANFTIAIEETKSVESETKPKKDKPMGQKLLEQKQNDQKNSKPTKVKIVDSQGGVAARLARFKQK